MDMKTAAMAAQQYQQQQQQQMAAMAAWPQQMAGAPHMAAAATQQAGFASGMQGQPVMYSSQQQHTAPAMQAAAGMQQLGSGPLPPHAFGGSLA